MRICANCGNKLGKKDKFCGKCGSSDINETSSLFGIDLGPKTKKCIYCGTMLDGKAKFCWSCGKSTEGGVSLSFLDEKPAEAGAQGAEQASSEPLPELDFLKSAEDFSSSLGNSSNAGVSQNPASHMAGAVQKKEEEQSAYDAAPRAAAWSMPQEGNVQLGTPAPETVATDFFSEKLANESNNASVPLAGPAEKQEPPKVSAGFPERMAAIPAPLKEEPAKAVEEKPVMEEPVKPAEEKPVMEEPAKPVMAGPVAAEPAKPSVPVMNAAVPTAHAAPRYSAGFPERMAAIPAKIKDDKPSAEDAAKKAEEEAARKAEEEEAAKKAEEEAKKKAEEEAARKAEEEAAAKKAAEEAARKAEEEAKKKAEEEAKKKAEEEEAARKAAEEEAARKAAEEEARKKAEEEAARKAAEEEAKRKAEEEERRKAEEEAARKAAEEEAKRKAEEEERRKAEEEAARKAEEERIKAEEEARKKAQEEERKKIEELKVSAKKAGESALKSARNGALEAKIELEAALDEYRQFENRSGVNMSEADDNADFIEIEDRLGVYYYQEKAYKLALPLIKDAAAHGRTKSGVYYVEWITRNRSEIPAQEGVLPAMLDKALADEETASDDMLKRKIYLLYARVCREGLTVKRDLSAAYRYCMEAANLDDPEGIARVGQCLLYGEGVKRDAKEAFAWNEKAAALGEEKGIRNTAVALDYGTGVKRDALKAVEWYKKLLELVPNDRFAKYRISYCLSNPDKLIGVKPDEAMLAEAYKYASDAVADGEHDAEFVLGYLLTLPLNGGPDYNESYTHFAKAANHGNDKAKLWLQKFVKNPGGSFMFRG